MCLFKPRKNCNEIVPVLNPCETETKGKKSSKDWKKEKKKNEYYAFPLQKNHSWFVCWHKVISKRTSAASENSVSSQLTRLSQVQYTQRLFQDPDGKLLPFQLFSWSLWTIIIAHCCSLLKNHWHPSKNYSSQFREYLCDIYSLWRKPWGNASREDYLSISHSSSMNLLETHIQRTFFNPTECQCVI